MVSITVVLIAVLGTFSFGLVYGTVTTPQGSFSTEVDVTTDRIEIAHTGGEALDPDRTRIVVVNESDRRSMELVPDSRAGSFEAGDRIVITTSEGSISGWRVEPANLTFEIRPDSQYTVEIIDDRSRTVVYRVSLVAG